MVNLQNITFAYADQLILNDVTLHAGKGEHIGILGESGCGKSTLLKIIAGIYPPTSGIVKVNNSDHPTDIIRSISMVLQTPMLLPMTILENITLGHDCSRERIDEICRMTCLEQWIHSLPEGIHTYLGNSANELSGGQAQRIAIARAMYKDTDILLLDEPTSALDQETASMVLTALEHFTADKTVIHVTHHPAHLSGYDKIYHMEKGRIISGE